MDRLLPAAAFVAVLALCMSAVSAYEKRKRREQLLQRLSVSSDTQESGLKEQLLEFLGSMGRFGVPKKEEEALRIRKDLLHAGFHGEDILLQYYGARLSLGLAFAILFPLFLAMVGKSVSQNLFYIPFALTLGYYLPPLFVARAKKIRGRRIFRELPDTIDLLVIGLEAGLSLDAALYRVSREMKNMAPTVSKEFGRYFFETQGGIPRNEALSNIKKRSSEEGLRSLVDVLLQSVKFGTDMSAALRAYAESMRFQRVVLAQEKAAKIAPKLTIPMILFILPALVIVILGPGAIRLLERLSGSFF